MSRNGTINLANVRAARDAGLVYVSDDAPGYTRKKAGKAFVYVDARGRRVRSPQALARIRALAIPPAYRDVWICADPRGHIQAVGRDDRGRKQYRYHEQWRAVRDENKYGRMLDFARALPKLRRRVNRDLRRHGLPREKVLAAVVRFMESTLIRVGNDEYAKNNKSFGLTTLQDRHAKISKQKVKLEFRGKSGVEHEFEVQDPRLAEIARRCQDLPGQELFQYLDEKGQVRDVGSADVNDYLREVTGRDFTAKDFRTWAGTVLAATALVELHQAGAHRGMKKNVLRAVERVAEKLGNTRAVCRKCYIHPAIIETYEEGGLLDALAKRQSKASDGGLCGAEAAVLALLKRRVAQQGKGRSQRPRTIADALRQSLKAVARRKAS